MSGRARLLGPLQGKHLTQTTMSPLLLAQTGLMLPQNGLLLARPVLLLAQSELSPQAGTIGNDDGLHLPGRFLGSPPKNTPGLRHRLSNDDSVFGYLEVTKRVVEASGAFFQDADDLLE